MQAVVLAGGKGSRMRGAIGDRPKPLAEINGVPLLQHQMVLAKRHGFTDVLVLVNHQAQQITHFLDSKNNFGLRVRCIDDGRPRGTAGAVIAARHLLADEFLVLYGDTMLDVDLTRFHGFHVGDPTAAATLMVHPNDHPADSDLVEIDDQNRIVRFHPYPHDPGRYYQNLVNAALFWIRRRALQGWPEEGSPLDFGKHIFPRMVQEGWTLRAYQSPEYIKDIGTPERLQRVSSDFASGRISARNLARPQSMVFLDRDGTINRERHHLKDPAQLELLPGSEAAIKRLNASTYRCCVVSNQPVIARGECSVEELRAIHNKLESLLARHGAYLDRIYYCPHHPDGGFDGERKELKFSCECRKPKIGLIERAVKDFNVALDQSWLIGDSSTDLETARRAGIRSILVETGHAGLDYRWWALPDVIVPDLYSAVSYILDTYPQLLSYCREIGAQIYKGQVVLIGGQSRSGKSTFASALRDALKSLGHEVVVLSADRWLKNEKSRAPSVLGRYDITSLQGIVDQLAEVGGRPRSVILPGYHKLRRETVEQTESVFLTAATTVLIEGTIALCLKAKETSAFRIHVQLDEEERKRRVIREYKLRGLDAAACLEIYTIRRKDEFALIEESSDGAQRVSITALAANPTIA